METGETNLVEKPARESDEGKARWACVKDGKREGMKCGLIV